MTGPTVFTPLRCEWLALRNRIDLEVVRTGRSRGSPALGAPTLVAGLAGGLVDTLLPGDLVVASEIRTRDRTLPTHGAELVVGALRRQGLRVHHGPVVTTHRVVHGLAGRAALAASGSIAVDTESALLADPAGRTVVLRAVVDTPHQPLWRPGTAIRGIRALSALRRAASAIEAWGAAVGDREVLLAQPRSFCAGVERAIEVVERALEQFGAPVYVRRQIVHNAHVVADLKARGAVFVQEVEEVPTGAVLVLAAHGVAPEVRRRASGRGLRVIDATCPLVSKVHQETRRFAESGRTVLLIGHADHEEVVGTRGEAPDRVIVVADADEASRVEVRDPDKVAYVMQTTLAVDEAEETAAVLRERFPRLSGPRRDDICYATSNRQQAVREVARECDLMLVVGSQNSSNSQRLVEVAEASGARAHLVDDPESVELAWLADVSRIGISAGASAPPSLVDDLITNLSGLGRVAVRESSIRTEDIQFSLPREVSQI